MLRDRGASAQRQELHAGEEPVGLDREVTIRRLDPVPVGASFDQLGEPLPLHMTTDVIDDRVGNNQIEPGVSVGFCGAGISGHRRDPIGRRCHGHHVDQRHMREPDGKVAPELRVPPRSRTFISPVRETSRSASASACRVRDGQRTPCASRRQARLDSRR